MVYDPGSVVIDHADTVAQIIEASIAFMAVGDADAIFVSLLSGMDYCFGLIVELLVIEVGFTVLIHVGYDDHPASTEDDTR